jgi:MscS family membrane protein
VSSNLVRWLVSASLLLAAAPASAQLPGLPKPAAATPTPGAGAVPEVEAPDSPRASARAFRDLAMRKGDYVGAARYLVLPAGEEQRGPELARRMRAVLERHLDIRLDALSPSPDGQPDDGLPEGVDALGQVPDGRGGEDTLFIVRVRDAEGTHWAFSRQTVSRIDGWYDALPDRWIRDSLPEPLQRMGPFAVLWWQWLALPLLIGLALAAGRFVGSVTARVLHRLLRRTRVQWDERLLRQVAPALTLLWTVAAAALLLPWLALGARASGPARAILGGAATIGVFWVLWRAVDAWIQYLLERPWALENPSARSLLSVTRNIARVLVALAGLVAALAAFGYPVATVLAGLGIGGIAIAFGALKTIENLFGSISLATDQPFRVGDLVKVEDVVGHVERIGMRSTQIRTFERTLVSIPNGKLSEMRIEDYAARDRIRLTATLGLVYQTSEEQLHRVIDGVEALLRTHPKIWPDTVVVSFLGFGASSLDIELLCWFATSDFGEFRKARQEVLFGIMRVVCEAGTSFAFPTQTLHVGSLPR